MQVNVFVFDSTPQTFDEDIIQGSSPAVHADEDFMVLEAAGKLIAGELSPLVGIEHHGLGPAEGLKEGLYAECSV